MSMGRLPILYYVAMFEGDSKNSCAAEGTDVYTVHVFLHLLREIFFHITNLGTLYKGMGPV